MIKIVFEYEKYNLILQLIFSEYKMYDVYSFMCHMYHII